MAEHYYTVGVHGSPTTKTAPHGFAWQSETGKWWNSYSYVDGGGMGADAKWFPLPAPPTEQAPPPEPVARWEAVYRGVVRAVCGVIRDLPETELQAAADALNALDANGVAWGPGRPMSELPDGHRKRVLLVDPSGHTWIDSGTHRGFDEKAMRAGWWPLPLPGEAQ